MGTRLSQNRSTFGFASGGKPVVLAPFCHPSLSTLSIYYMNSYIDSHILSCISCSIVYVIELWSNYILHFIVSLRLSMVVLRRL